MGSVSVILLLILLTKHGLDLVPLNWIGAHLAVPQDLGQKHQTVGRSVATPLMRPGHHGLQWIVHVITKKERESKTGIQLVQRTTQIVKKIPVV